MMYGRKMYQQVISSSILMLSVGYVLARPDSVKLNTNAIMPLVGYGTWQALDAELEDALNHALAIGYRHIDTATLYKNEHVIGRVINEWIRSGKGKREDLFITTKLPPYGTHPKSVSSCLQESLRKLQLQYVDLYLIHGPLYMPPEAIERNGIVNTNIPTDLIGTWKAMEVEMQAGRTKAIGVSNFNQSQIERIQKIAKIQPANLQVELHVYLQQKSLVEFCKKSNISVTSFSSLGSRGSFHSIMKGIYPPPNMLEDETVVRIAKNHDKTAAQILLKYLVQNEIAVIPKSTNENRIRQNFEIFDFTLTEEEMNDIANLDKGESGRILRLSQIIKGIEKHPEYPYTY